MAFIPPGAFLMGSTIEDLRYEAELDEYPQHEVYVDGFYMDIHEVTNAQYKFFADSMGVEPPHAWGYDGNYPIGRDGYPVVSVSFKEAAAYARFVGKRLPTEAEWEKAARGSDGRRYPWGDEFDNTKGNNGEQLLPVMSLPEGKSPYGLFDMAGNAAEWVDSWYAAYPRESAASLPSDLGNRKIRFGDKKYRVYRGGSWNGFGKFMRCANRERTKTGKKWQYIGFRCAMDPPWEND